MTTASVLPFACCSKDSYSQHRDSLTHTYTLSKTQQVSPTPADPSESRETLRAGREMRADTYNRKWEKGEKSAVRTTAALAGREGRAETGIADSAPTLSIHSRSVCSGRESTDTEPPHIHTVLVHLPLIPCVCIQSVSLCTRIFYFPATPGDQRASFFPFSRAVSRSSSSGQQAASGKWDRG
jgi:hypothetical protein